MILKNDLNLMTALKTNQITEQQKIKPNKMCVILYYDQKTVKNSLQTYN